MWSTARSGSRCQSPAMPNRRCRMHGGSSPVAPRGNKNALKHGRYTAEAVAIRREIATLLRKMKYHALPVTTGPNRTCAHRAEGTIEILSFSNAEPERAKSVFIDDGH